MKTFVAVTVLLLSSLLQCCVSLLGALSTKSCRAGLTKMVRSDECMVPKSPRENEKMNPGACILAAASAGLSFTSVSFASDKISDDETLKKYKDSERGDDFDKDLGLPRDAYSVIDGMRSCKIVNGMWQVSGAHGYQPSVENSVSDMTKLANSGFTSFDLADIYGPAEGYVGSFTKGPQSSAISRDCRFFTKWVTGSSSAPVTRQIASAAIDRSLERMRTDRIDLLQFHWWDYSNKNYYAAMNELMRIQQDGKIRSLGLCNFDTKHMLDLVEQEAPIVTNQVSFSILDTRPLEEMIPACKKHNIQLLVYGVLLGGFLSENWLDKPEPISEKLTNVSLRKYLPWIKLWGGWGKFQVLLKTLKEIANKHQVSLSNVAMRWVLQQEQVAGLLIGVRFGLKDHDHIVDNKKLFSFSLDTDDMAK